MTRSPRLLAALLGCGFTLGCQASDDDESAVGTAQSAPLSSPSSNRLVGEVLVSASDGSIAGWNTDGTLRSVVSSNAGAPTAMRFDGAGRLHVARWCADNGCAPSIQIFDADGAPASSYGSGSACRASSLVIDPQGGTYVAHADCVKDVVELDADGRMVDAFELPGATDSPSIDLADDGCTLYYTSEGAMVSRYDVCARRALGVLDVEPPATRVAYAVAALADGGALVAHGAGVTRLDGRGQVAAVYPLAGNDWRAVAFDPSGSSFWASSFDSGDVVRIDVATGEALGMIHAGALPRTTAMVVYADRPDYPPDYPREPPCRERERRREGFMTGGGSIFLDDGTRVTHGFRLLCDATDTPNRLQINTHPDGGGSGDRFHLELLTSALCTDDPSIEPDPPAAPFDTYEGTGIGRWNGKDGATAEWLFTDAGEPGDNDTIGYLVVRDDNGNIVINLTLPGKTLTYGNHQAHANTPGG